MVFQMEDQEHHERAPQRLVLKFGGTSVGKFAREIVKICLYFVSPSSFAN